ncbi:hypothetical protein [Rhodopirellula europaea]|uniref:hypothetical protein n=1 Tax=Rhodopirellula europaea TaxID=1263866 RepID=UPI003D2A1472|tara:strand:- start:79749 stop:80597 length:849 start_codon:yes stop_codon:yes gene_type:complete
MKRRVPNRRRLFIQNLENRCVLAGCMGMEAATDDLITEEAAEVSSVVAGATDDIINSAAIEVTPNTESIDTASDAEQTTEEDETTSNAAEEDAILNQDDATPSTEADTGRPPHPRHGAHHLGARPDALSADAMGVNGTCNETTEETETEVVNEDAADDLEDSETLNNESGDELESDDLSPGVTEDVTEAIEEEDAIDVVDNGGTTFVPDTEDELLVDPEELDDEAETTVEAKVTETASLVTADEEISSDDETSLCLFHEELDSIFAELGNRDLADAQIYILI